LPNGKDIVDLTRGTNLG